MSESDGNPTTPTHLTPSALGTKEYWDALYASELSNHLSNPSDEGTVWFDDADAEAKTVAFLDDGELLLREGGLADRAHASVLDLGCGNGSLLFALRDAGWGAAGRGRLLGVDYSERSVELARRVAAARGVGVGAAEEGSGGDDDDDDDDDGDGEGEGTGVVEFKAWDVLRGALDDVRNDNNNNNTAARPDDGRSEASGAGWDLVLDKGTFDAVSLSDERDAQGRRVCEGYGERVVQLLRPGGIFLVTSCNWTETELRDWFEVKTQGLRLAGRIEYPSFSFGGVKGQTISTLCFRKAAE